LDQQIRIRNTELITLKNSVVELWIRIRMNPLHFGLMNPYPESAVSMRIPDADPDLAI
jgi:hypothetical protein